MSQLAHRARFEALLQHPSFWRGQSAAAIATVSTGFAALDQLLPGGGWPRRGLIEILTPGMGFGELALCAPLVARATRTDGARWCTFVAPPFEPFAPAWSACGTRLDRLLVVRGEQSLWALEQSLLSGACAVSFGWAAKASMTELRRLALAAESGASLGVLIRPLQVAGEHTAAVLRMALSRTATHLCIDILKCRGMAPRRLEIAWS
jgi:hypothetical protein